jgi:surface polysaccharide O-acyltransferase-like enzyme
LANSIEVNKRVEWLDTVRALAVFLVVLVHSPTVSVPNVWVSIYNYISRPCIGLFFMVTGALLLPVTQPIDVFLRRRFSRILSPLLIWSLFYIAVKWYYRELAADQILLELLKILFGPVEGILWFIYTLAGLYLFAPILSKWILCASRKELDYFLCLWAVTLTLPYLNAVYPTIYNVEGSYYGSFAAFGGYMGYMVLGYSLRRYPIKLCTLTDWARNIFIVIGVCGCWPAIFYLKQYQSVPNPMIYNFLTINIALMAVVIFTIIQRFPIRCIWLQRIISEFSSSSFGIYLVHIFIMHRIVWKWVAEPARYSRFVEIPLVAMITFLLSYLTVRLLALLPGSKYIVGYNRR